MADDDDFSLPLAPSSSSNPLPPPPRKQFGTGNGQVPATPMTNRDFRDMLATPRANRMAPPPSRKAGGGGAGAGGGSSEGEFKKPKAFSKPKPKPKRDLNARGEREIKHLCVSPTQPYP